MSQYLLVKPGCVIYYYNSPALLAVEYVDCTSAECLYLQPVSWVWD